MSVVAGSRGGETGRSFGTSGCSGGGAGCGGGATATDGAAGGSARGGSDGAAAGDAGAGSCSFLPNQNFIRLSPSRTLHFFPTFRDAIDCSTNFLFAKVQIEW